MILCGIDVACRYLLHLYRHARGVDISSLTVAISITYTAM